MNSNVRFMYLRDVSGHPHSCVAIRVNKSESTVNYVVSRCDSPVKRTRLKRRMQRIIENGGIVPQAMIEGLQALPLDFRKSCARVRAEERLNTNANEITIAENSSVHSVTHSVMMDIFTQHVRNGHYSNEVGLAAYNWINKNEARRSV